MWWNSGTVMVEQWKSNGGTVSIDYNDDDDDDDDDDNDDNDDDVGYRN